MSSVSPSPVPRDCLSEPGADARSSRECRICWGEEDNTCEGGRLVTPCRCAGSLCYIHVRCLQDWQEILRSQGQFRKARHCEICKQQYRIPSSRPGCGRGSKTWEVIKDLATRANQQLLELFHCRSWLPLAYRAWQAYVLGSGVVGAAKLGAAGLRAGFGWGKTLVEEQTGILLHLLAAMGDVMGTPYAELLWCQAVACVAFGLVSEMVYTSVMGLLIGSVFGFAKGYISALHATLCVAGASVCRSLAAGRGLAKVAGLALRLPWAALRGATSAAARSLPVRLL